MDADIAREDEVAFSAMDLGAVIEKLDSARNPVNLVILDACRDNPFGNRIQMSAKGLAQVEAPPGTLIAFATAPGTAASDGGRRNGLYTGHLVAEMRKPGAPIEEIFKAVRAGVRKDSGGLQVPWESTSLESPFAFHPSPAKPRPAAIQHAADAGGKARRVPSTTVPPMFQPGDTWTYTVRDMRDGSEAKRSFTVREINGEQIVWQNELRGDLLGNFTRVPTSGQMHTFTPSTQHYVFPMRPGAMYNLEFVQETPERVYDGKVRLTVGDEEEIATAAGKLRTVKVTREVQWQQRGREYGGVNVWTYWYSPAAKRWIRGENTNTTNKGKMILHELWELDSFKVH